MLDKFRCIVTSGQVVCVEEPKWAASSRDPNRLHHYWMELESWLCPWASRPKTWPNLTNAIVSDDCHSHTTKQWNVFPEELVLL